MKLLVSLAMQLALLLMAFSANAEPPKAVQLLESANLHEVTHLYPSLPPTTRIFHAPIENTDNIDDNVSTYRVRVNFLGDPGIHYPSAIRIANGIFQKSGNPRGNDFIDFEVPLGVYDIMCLFRNNIDQDISLPAFSIVVLESINVEADMELNADPTTATNLIQFQSYNPDGSRSRLPLDSQYGEDNGDPNVYAIYYYVDIQNKITGYLNGFIVFADSTNSSQDPDRIADVLINNLSDNFLITQNRIILPISDEPSILNVKLTANDIKPCIISNNPDNFMVIKNIDVEDKFIKTPSYDDFEREGGYNWEIASLIFRENLYEGQSFLCKKFPNIYFDSPFNSEYPLCNQLVSINQIESHGYNDYYERILIRGIVSPYIIQRNGQFEFSLEPFVTGCFAGRSEYQAGIECYWDGKFNPYIHSTFPLDEGRFGSSVPWAFFTNQDIDCSEWSGITERKLHGHILNYIGQYGELRDIDNSTVAVEVLYNGNKIKSFDEEDTFAQWSYEWLMSGEEPGELKYVITNENIEVEGLKGKNYIEAVLDERNEECTIPTLQYLGFEDSEGKYTNSFKTGKINLFAGDFFLALRENAQLSPKPSDYSVFSPLKSMTVEYAPYGSDDFTELNVEMIPGAVWHPFGQCYSAEIAGLSEGWYDIRVTMEDEAGNWQKQTISPAFKILDSSSVGITPYDTETTPTYYNLQGVRIDKPENGIFIERTGNSVRKVVK